jgi:CxxC motif-containing protein (DUF1111 family)
LFINPRRYAMITLTGLQFWLMAPSPILQALAQAQFYSSPDPGPRSGAVDVGGPLPGLSPLQSAYFFAARNRFIAIDSVSGAIPGESGSGLGPQFNGNSCAACHAYPTVGGSSPPINPQLALARLDGAHNSIPSFLSRHGPVREPRFVRKPDGSPDGNIHQIFVVSGRTDAPGCAIQQPDFATELANDNVRFRIPTPLFGLGLVEAVPDSSLRATFNSLARVRATLGIAGHFNTNPNDGTISRFGWKAQNTSLLLFAGEAYNEEMGVSNELFPNEINSDPTCAFNATPEDTTNLSPNISSASPASDYSSDIVNFAAFSRLSMAPAAHPTTTTTYLGQGVFQAIGCHACHALTQTTGPSTTTPSISDITFQPFSDFAVHHMGQGLTDGITQGTAEGDEFRTSPLWGLGQRLFLLHDGRTADLNEAIMAHSSQGSEANQVIEKYTHLSPDAISELMAFLRSL